MRVKTEYDIASEMPDSKIIVLGVKHVSVALYYKRLLSFEETEFCVKTGFFPNDLSTPGLEEIFEKGLVLDCCEDAFVSLAMRTLFKDPTLFN